MFCPWWPLFPKTYYYLENDLLMIALFSKLYYLFGNTVRNKSVYSEKHCVLGNLQWNEGYDFQKVLHIRKIEGRTNMFFPGCMIFWKNAVDTGPVFQRGLWSKQDQFSRANCNRTAYTDRTSAWTAAHESKQWIKAMDQSRGPFPEQSSLRAQCH